ncbi:hypothetical protein [Amycolatopsis sp. cmx-11-32]|uniref:hypothetical protein n=1 Tax=Amycolatopsis sp. cmx-11-32 TaxID=2785796 RepID=UPI0039E60378
MVNEWPPPADESSRLLAEVDTGEMPHAAGFAACLEALANSSNVYAWIPCIGTLYEVKYEFHNRGVPGHDYGASSIPVATPDEYLNAMTKPQYVSSVIEHLGTTPEHFMAFAEVLSGQHVLMSDSGYAGPDAYSPPIDWAFYNLAFDKGADTGSASQDVKEALADFAELNSAIQVLTEAVWEGPGQVAALNKFTQLMNFLIHVRGPMHAEFGATLVAYAALVKSARKQLDGIMGQADAAIRNLDASPIDLIKTLGVLLTLAGFIPAMPYALSFGIAVASMVASKLESVAKSRQDPEEITIPTEQSSSCVDILHWYLKQARATCEALSDGIGKLSKRLPELLDEVVNSVPEDVHLPEQLRELPQ